MKLERKQSSASCYKVRILWLLQIEEDKIEIMIKYNNKLVEAS